MKSMYSPNMRERMVIMMLENGNCTTATGQDITTSKNYFYDMMSNLRKRSPNAMISKVKSDNSRRYIYKLTKAGIDYALKVKSIREVERR